MTAESVQTVARVGRPFADVREYLAAVAEIDQLKQIDGANWDLEIGAITEVAASRSNSSVLLFDNIPDYKPGFRVATNLLSSTSSVRERIIYGCPLELTDAEAIVYWKRQLSLVRPVPPVTVSDGPVTEVVRRDDEVNLYDIPWVRWHERDGGRYMCATAAITRDPEEGYVNIGSYRFMLVNRDTIVVHIGSGHHGDVIRKKYWAQGKPCPIAISLGQEPSLLIAAGTNLAWGASEYDYAGWLRGAPVEVLPGPVTGLPIPAGAEVVLEGEMLPPADGTEIEGPFGEVSGYYGGGAQPTPITKIRAVLRRPDPIVLGWPPFHGAARELLGSRAIRVWSELESLGIPGIQAVNTRWGLCVISLKQSFPGHAMRAAHGCLGGTAGYHGRFVIVVDDDINAYDIDEVLWAVATRCDPETSLDVVRRIWSYRIDPRLDPDKKARGDFTGSVAIIDATRPFHWRDKYPATTGIPHELRSEIERRWGALLDS